MKLSPYPRTLLLLRLNQLSANFCESSFHRLALSNVLGEDENATHNPAVCPPGTNLPVNPTSGTVSTIPVVFVDAQRFTLQTPAVHLPPALGKVWKNIVLRTSKDL